MLAAPKLEIDLLKSVLYYLYTPLITVEPVQMTKASWDLILDISLFIIPPSPNQRTRNDYDISIKIA